MVGRKPFTHVQCCGEVTGVGKRTAYIFDVNMLSIRERDKLTDFLPTPMLVACGENGFMSRLVSVKTDVGGGGNLVNDVPHRANVYWY